MRAHGRGFITTLHPTRGRAAPPPGWSGPLVKHLPLLFVAIPSLACGAVLEGRVIDSERGGPVPAAIIYVGDLTHAEADTAGRFHIEGLPEVQVSVRIEHVAYQPWRRSVRLRETRVTQLLARMRPRVQILEPVEVRTVRADPSVPQGKRTITPMRIRRAAGVVATDPLRVVQALPGSAAAGDDFSNRYVVRGGDPEENLILFDGYALQQPIHLEGFTSVIYDDLVGGVEVYPGALPPRFGDALSSVTVLTPVRPKRLRRFFRYDLGSIALGGQFTGERADGVSAARASFYNLILRRPPGVKDRSFQDIAGKLNGVHGDLGSSLTFVGSRDRETGDVDRSIDGYLLGLRTGNLPGPQGWHIALSFTGRRLDAKTHKPASRTRNELTLASLTGDLVWNARPQLQARLDAEAHHDHFEDIAQGHSGTGGFLSSEATWTSPAIAFSLGGRIEKVPFTKGAPLSPYASLRSRSLGRFTPGIAWRIVRQSPFPFRESPEVAGLPVDPGLLLELGRGAIAPLKANHLSGSCETNLGRGITAGLEIYRKRYRNLLSWGQERPQPDKLDDNGTGEGRGCELSLRRDTGWITGLASYSISRTRKREGPAPATRPADHDQPRMLQLALDVPVRGGTSLSLGYRAATGRPITPLVEHQGQLVPGPINSERLPSYRRLDVKLEHRVTGSKTDAFFYLDVLNVTNRRNVVDMVQFIGGGAQVVRIPTQGVRILPVAGFGLYF